MTKIFEPYTKVLVAEITKIFAEREKAYATVSPWGKDVAQRFAPFATQGKLIRGSLVCFAAEMFGSEINNDVLKAGAAIEILHSSLLIHDDIMDNDALRRGKPSIYKQYELLGKKMQREDAEHIGISLGICAGDVGYFLCSDLIGDIQHEKSKQILQKISHEASLVGIAQMQDVIAYDGEILDEKHILHMYQFKTGRYSFSLPLAVGAMLADQSEDVLKQLERFGETVGVLFQLADDKLGLFGTPEQTGKLVGSDIKENKQTLYRAMLFQRATSSERTKLTELFGNHNITQKDINFIHDLIKKYAVDTSIDDLSKKFDAEANQIIATLPIDDTYKNTLKNLVTFIQIRKK